MQRRAIGNLVGLLNDLLALGEDELDVAGARHVGVDLETLVIWRNRAGESKEYVHGRGRGTSASAAWGPG